MEGYLGVTKTLGHLQRRVYWPGMSRGVPCPAWPEGCINQSIQTLEATWNQELLPHVHGSFVVLISWVHIPDLAMRMKTFSSSFTILPNRWKSVQFERCWNSESGSECTHHRLVQGFLQFPVTSIYLQKLNNLINNKDSSGMDEKEQNKVLLQSDNSSKDLFRNKTPKRHWKDMKRQARCSPVQSPVKKSPLFILLLLICIASLEWHTFLEILSLYTNWWTFEFKLLEKSDPFTFSFTLSVQVNFVLWEFSLPLMYLLYKN